MNTLFECSYILIRMTKLICFLFNPTDLYLFLKKFSIRIILILSYLKFYYLNIHDFSAFQYIFTRKYRLHLHFITILETYKLLSEM
jgi:hypothetical protein